MPSRSITHYRSTTGGAPPTVFPKMKSLSFQKDYAGDKAD